MKHMNGGCVVGGDEKKAGSFRGGNELPAFDA